MLPLYDLNHGEGIRGGCELICMPNNEYGWKKVSLEAWNEIWKGKKSLNNFGKKKKYSKYSEF